MAGGEAGLGRFLEAAGLSLGAAQQRLLENEEGPVAPTAMAISEVELEVKATFEGDAPEQVALRPLTSGEARGGAVDPGAVSTVRVRYVALAPEAVGGEAAGGTGAAPRRSAEAVVAEVRDREDLAVLDRVLGGLAYDATFVPAAGSWLVQVSDREGRIVREVAVPDAER